FRSSDFLATNPKTMKPDWTNLKLIPTPVFLVHHHKACSNLKTLRCQILPLLSYPRQAPARSCQATDQRLPCQPSTWRQRSLIHPGYFHRIISPSLGIILSQVSQISVQSLILARHIWPHRVMPSEVST